MAGKNPDLVATMTDTILRANTGAAIAAANKLTQDDGKLLGESAGQIAIQLLMSGQATNADDVRNTLNAACLQHSAAAIIANQRAARDALSKSMQ